MGRQMCETAVRVEASLMRRVERIRDRLRSETGMRVSRAAVLRRALELGVERMETETEED